MKNYLIIGLILIVILISTFLYVNIKKSSKLENTISYLENEVDSKTNAIETYVNKNGQLVTKVLEYQKDISDLGKSYNKLSSYTDSVELKIKNAIKSSSLLKRQLDEAMFLLSETNGGGIFNTDTIRDTVVVKTFNDGFLDLVINGDSLWYNYKDEFVVLDASRLIDRKFFLWRWIGWKKLTDQGLVEVVSSNPKTVNKVTKIKFK